MAEQSRRTFLTRASVGTAAIGAAAVAPSLLGGGVAEADTESGPEHGAEFVVWVRNPRAGEVSFLVGEKELTLTDRKLAKRLAQAAARAARS